MSNPKRKNTSHKDDRIQLRTTSFKKRIIAMASEIKQKTVSDFVLDEAYEEAQRVLAEQAHFYLPEDKWEEYNKALEAPVRDLPNLKKLFAEPSIFVEE
jgi:uncharacterized protein (DUF1778 family)